LLLRLWGRLLGHPLDAPLAFALMPFSPAFEQVWQRTLAYIRPQGEAGLEVGPTTNGAFDEYLCTLLLSHHPHNYSDELSAPAPSPVPGLVRRAERYMVEHLSSPIGVPDVTAHLGVSVRTLQAGFRQWRSTTPNAHLMQTRLQLRPRRPAAREGRGERDGCSAEIRLRISGTLQRAVSRGVRGAAERDVEAAGVAWREPVRAEFAKSLVAGLQNRKNLLLRDLTARCSP